MKPLIEFRGIEEDNFHHHQRISNNENRYRDISYANISNSGHIKGEGSEREKESIAIRVVFYIKTCRVNDVIPSAYVLKSLVNNGKIHQIDNRLFENINFEDSLIKEGDIQSETNEILQKNREGNGKEESDSSSKISWNKKLKTF